MRCMQPDTPPQMRRVPIALGGANCIGRERNLLGCPGAALGSAAGCTHADDVYVLCHAEPDPGAPRPFPCICSTPAAHYRQNGAAASCASPSCWPR